MWSRSVPVGEVRRLGDCAFLIGVVNARAARDLIEAIDAAAFSGVREIVGGLASVMVALDRTATTRATAASVRRALERLARDLGRRGREGSSDPAPAHHLISCIFDGPDLDEVAERTGCASDEVVDLLTAATLTVAVIGFSPGFAYLEGLPDVLAAVPRRARPRPAVPAGSVALAGGHAAVYPSASPGGWHLIGRTNEAFFDPRRPPYCRFAPGDQVRFSNKMAPLARGCPEMARLDQVMARRRCSWLNNPDCAPCAKTVGEQAWRRSGSRVPDRLMAMRWRWRIGWWETVLTRRPSRSRRGARPFVAGATPSSRSSALTRW